MRAAPIDEGLAVNRLRNAEKIAAVLRAHGASAAEAAALPEHGWSLAADLHSREAGERMVEDMVAGLGTIQRRLLAEWDPERPSRLRTFGDVERFWDEEVRPVLPGFKSLRSTWYPKAAPEPGSRWRENWPSSPRPSSPDPSLPPTPGEEGERQR